MSTAAECRQFSYEAIKADKHLMYKRVMTVLEENGPMTAEEVAQAMFDKGWLCGNGRHRIAPRLTELEKEKGVVTEWGKKIASTGRPVTIYAAVKEWRDLLTA